MLIQATLLGCGTSTGVPVLGCRCSICTSLNPRNKRLRTSCHIKVDNKRSFLIDASPDFRQQALTHYIDYLDGVLFTHGHADHILGTEDLRGLSYVRSSPLPCYAEAHTAKQIRSLFSYIFDPDPNYVGGGLARLSLIDSLTPGVSFSLEGVEITPFRLYHGTLPILGYRIGSLVYATDCNHIPEESFPYLENAEVLFLDGLRFEPHPTHFTIPEAIKLAQRIKAQSTWLIHLTHTVDFDEVSLDLPQGIQLGYDGLTVTIGT
jgi:phosphoribosyl 1,2-cyclic phosphate phosphodiesterase